MCKFKADRLKKGRDGWKRQNKLVNITERTQITRILEQNDDDDLSRTF